MRAILLSILLIPIAGCDSPKPKQVVHRLQVGTPVATGWITADSSKGRFTVKIPVPFNDVSIVETDPSSITQNIEMVGGKSTEGIKFIAIKTFYREKGSAGKQFEKSKTGGGLPSATTQAIQHNGYPAVDIFFSDSKSRLNSRTVLIGEEIFMLSVEWPIEQDSLARPLVRPFLESLNVQK